MTLKNKKVLLVDLDSQHNLTDIINFKADFDKTSYDLFFDAEVKDLIIETNFKDLDIIPASEQLSDIDLDISDIENKEFILDNKFYDFSINADYDYVIFDTPPSLDYTVINTLCCCDSIIVTSEPSILSIDGFEQLYDVYKLIKENVNTNLTLEGVLITRIDRRSTIAEEFREDFKDIYNNINIFDTMISQSVIVANSQLKGLPVSKLDKNNRVAKEYLSLANEILKEG